MIASEKGNFFMVSNRIFELGLKPRDFIVYCCLLRHSDNNTRTCFPSRRLIAKECCMDRKTVDSAIEDLSALGLVKKIQRYRENGTRTSNLYYVADLSMDTEDAETLTMEYQEQMEQQASAFTEHMNTVTSNMSSQAGKMSEQFLKTLSEAEGKMKKCLTKAFWISLIPTAALIIWELIRHFWLQS